MEQVTVSPTSPSMSRLVLETPIFLLYLHLGLGISDKKFHGRQNRQKMVCSHVIPVVLRNRKLSEFYFEPFRREKMLGIPWRGTKIEANSRNFVLNHSPEEKKTTQNSIPWNEKRSKLSDFCSELSLPRVYFFGFLQFSQSPASKVCI
jgi:hypothetical protein